MSIGEKIKELRKREKLNQEEFGKKVGISKNAVWNYENGKREPSLEILTKISKAFDIPMIDILRGYDSEDKIIDQLQEKFKDAGFNDPLSEAIHYACNSVTNYEYQQTSKELNFAFFEPFRYLIANKNNQEEFNYKLTDFSEDELIAIENFLKEMFEFKINQIKKNKN